MRKIFIYGAPGAGKSTVGKILAQNLNVPFIDIDNEIEAKGSTISEIIARSGEIHFRDMESAILFQVCNSGSGNKNVDPITYNAVVALGGGALLREENRVLIESSGDIVFLDAEPKVLLERLSVNDGTRPLLSGNVEVKLVELLEKRNEHYSSFELRVESTVTDNQGKVSINAPENISWKIQQMLGRFYVKGMGLGYDVIIEPGGLESLGYLLKERKLNGPVVVVCDENVGSYYGKRVVTLLGDAGFSATLLVIPAGEQYKTIETVSLLWGGFLRAGIDRNSTIVALGGGVVGDLTGFAAATFMRGCQWVVVPTTLLSMVDASTGGKTGFDLPEGKNLIGAFYPPRLVLADPNVLQTLPESEFISGLAEVIKHGVISDPELFVLCEKGIETIKADITAIVRRAMAVKINVIEQDPFEKGVRAALNLGHTVGHAVEIVSRFQLKHGEAVAIGMVAEGRLAERLGLAEQKANISERIQSALVNVGLPTEIPADMDKSLIIKAMKVDKKKEGSIVKFALPLDIGSVRVGVSISDLENVL